MNKIRNVRAYFKQHRRISLLVDVMMAVAFISLSILLFGRDPGAFVGFFIYITVSNLIGTNLSMSNPDIFGGADKAKE
ncbi:hypothetical protein ACSYGW_14555 [Bacillus glycinifermentans]|uniref:hypothetical protein n=1 Tax=Bacillus glycinifermentans TaxID=1664069 RepID=UPI004059128A